MRLVTYTDEDGYNRQVLLRDSDTDDDIQRGIPLDPPSLADWPGIPAVVKKDLHNELVARGLITWADVLAQQSGVTALVQLVARRHQLDSEGTRQLRRAILAEYRR